MVGLKGKGDLIEAQCLALKVFVFGDGHGDTKQNPREEKTSRCKLRVEVVVVWRWWCVVVVRGP